MIAKPSSKLIALLLLSMLVYPQSLCASEEHHRIVVTSTSTSAAVFGDGRRLNERQQGLQWQLPDMDVAALRVSTGMQYAYTRYEYQNTPSRDRDLHMLQLPLSVAFESDKTLWQMLVAPGIATSSNISRDLFNRATSEDVFVTGDIVYANELSTGLVALGIVHDRRFGRPLTYPKVAWRGKSDQFEWQIGLPDTWVDFRPRQSTLLSLGAGPVGMQWHTVRDDFQSDFEYRTRRWDVRLEVHQKVTDSFSLSLHAGRAFDRRHRFEADSPVILDLSARNAWFGGISLSVGAHRRQTSYANAF